MNNINLENIKSLAELFSAHRLTSLEIRDGDSKIEFKKEIPVANATTVQAQPAAAAPAAIAAPGPAPAAASADDKVADFNHLAEVKSPLVGVFYSASGPDTEPFVSIGSKVNKGDVLCIIETMKLMNEVTAEKDGEIVDICVKNGDIAEFGQVLFKMF